MIDRVRFRNFKALQSLDISIGSLSVFVGPNSSGKTSILEGIHYLGQLTSNQDYARVFHGSRALSVLRSSNARSDLELSFNADSDWAFHMLARPHESAGAHDGSAAHNSEPEWDVLLRGITPFEQDALQPLPWGGLRDDSRRELRSRFGKLVLLKFDARRLAKPSYSERPVPRVEFGGTGLASVLAYVKLNLPENFDEIVEELRLIVPSVTQVRFRREKVRRSESQIVSVGTTSVPVKTHREYWGDALLFDTTSARDLPAHLMSEGTILVLGLLTVVRGPQTPRIVLMDDIDRALHPAAQSKVIDALRKIQQSRSDLQIIATSHSPYLLDALRPEEVRLTTLRDDGSVACAKLTSHPDFDRWKDVMAPGEFWSMIGEDWIRNVQSAEVTG